MVNSSKYLFISISSTPWDGPWYVRQKLMSEFSKKHKVIYVNQRRELREVVSSLLKFRSWTWGIRKIGDNLLLVESPWIFPKIYKLKYLDRLIEWLYHRFIRTLAAAFGRDCVKILYLWEPQSLPVARHYRKDPFIYHPYDLFEKYTYVRNGGGNATAPSSKEEERALRELNEEKRWVGKAALFYSVSELLCDHYDRKLGRRPMLLTNAVQDIYFEENDEALKAEAKKILAPFTKKKIGISGSLIGSLDLDIIIESAGELESYLFLFIGTVRYTNIREYDEKLEKLFSLKNVAHIGPFRVSILPYLLRQMDILAMIYSSNKTIWTYYGGPSKLFEYMAIGKPILSTPHPAVDEYRRYISVVENSKEWVAAVKTIEAGIDDRFFQEMKQIAGENTWEEREKVILDDIRSQRLL